MSQDKLKTKPSCHNNSACEKQYCPSQQRLLLAHFMMGQLSEDKQWTQTRNQQLYAHVDRYEVETICDVIQRGTGNVMARNRLAIETRIRVCWFWVHHGTRSHHLCCFHCGYKIVTGTNHGKVTDPQFFGEHQRLSERLPDFQFVRVLQQIAKHL